MCQNNDLNQQKTKTRKILKTARATIVADERLRKSQAITKSILGLDEIKTASNIFIYVSYATEVYTHDLIDALLKLRKTLAVPKIIDAKHIRAEYMTDWQTMTRDVMGILSPSNNPVGNQAFDLAITPGLGFTASGQRIGYGRGYYDKWFSQHPVKHKIGLAFEVQLLDTLPIANTDTSMDKIVTEQRVITVPC